MLHRVVGCGKKTGRAVKGKRDRAGPEDGEETTKHTKGTKRDEVVIGTRGKRGSRTIPKCSAIFTADFRMTGMRKRAFSLPELPGLLFKTRPIGVSEQLREGTTTDGHEWTRMRMGRCSRGRQPRTMPTMRPPKAIPNHPEFTADVADGADRWSRNETAGTR